MAADAGQQSDAAVPQHGLSIRPITGILSKALPNLSYGGSMDSSTASQNRRSRRSSVLLTATLETRSGAIPVKLRNLSAEGALVEGEGLPLEGAEVLFRRKDLVERGDIVWVDGKHAGVAFREKLQPEQVLRHVPTPRPTIRPEFRRPGLACRELTVEEKRLIDSWAWAPDRPRPGE